MNEIAYLPEQFVPKLLKKKLQSFLKINRNQSDDSSIMKYQSSTPTNLLQEIPLLYNDKNSQRVHSAQLSRRKISPPNARYIVNYSKKSEP
jgi:hypothetical protein